MSELHQGQSLGPLPDYESKLLPFYKPNVWYLRKHPLFEQVDPDKRSRIGNGKVDFNLCRNPLLRAEVKYYFQSKLEIEKVKLITIISKRTELYHFFEFMAAVYPDVGSVLMVDREAFRLEMVRYAEEHLGAKVFETVYRVDKNMDWHGYLHIGRVLGQMYWIPEAIETFLKTDGPFNFSDDAWDIRKTPFKDKIPMYRPRYIITFSKIKQPNIKDTAKRFIYHKLAIREISTCQDYLKSINLFSEFLWSRHYEIHHLAEVTRAVMEEFLLYVHEQEQLCERTKGYRIGKLREFLDACILLDLPEQPERRLILDSDYHAHIKPMPKFFTEDELRQFNQNAYKLPLTIARMLLVIETVGMRISELSALKSDCLSEDSEGNPVLTYYQYKTKKVNRVPISHELRECIQNEINDARAIHGEHAKYVFYSSTGNPVSVETFQRYLNVLSKENGFIDRAGRPLRVKSHSFRATVATSYMNIGVDPNVIRMMIGQADIRSLQYYAEASEERVHHAMAPIIEQQNEMIRSIGSGAALSLEANEDRLRPLCNGECMKKEGCDHFNACYSCAMFKPKAECIAIYKFQLQRAEESIALAKSNGMTRLLEINEDLRDNLVKIIRSINADE